MSLQDTEELKANLFTYKEQLKQVKELLVVDSGNTEYQEMAIGLTEVLELTYDLLNEAQQAKEDAALELEQQEAAAANTHSPPRHPSATYKPQQNENFVHIPGRLSVGTKVQAIWSEDGEWYKATVEAVTPGGYFVLYDEWGNKEEVDASNVRELNIPDDEVEVLDQMLGGAEVVDNVNTNSWLDAEQEANLTRLALKKTIEDAADINVISRGVPPKLRIKPDDSEDVIAAKKKKIHAFKSKARLEQMELTQNKRQNAWQQFQTTKGKSKKQGGFFTGRKRESIFKSPDDPKGKVGVTGSGKGTTEFHKREKHLHLKLGVGDGETYV
ncbi:uncharacterized protein [Physcomitrium patens]|uniref:Survival of motor neuron-related-splicing factor 30 n=1 Tax=Physcomitrium patens TaxID=3218 RepID=A0A2K1L948_PHYPA|nr:survival of motor neuron-related-splicing factor 30-like isoform X1 [Physcomitrium patens]PNR62555.1 hypothetical protein PHYPA_000979 [Physcomitrium patens]|eukprot:XP_024369417.1 survival of motor neuron-related-splicing factor 30-like isoform X1 [Physcomitrella patens]